MIRDCNLNLKTAKVDYEQGLIKSIRDEFFPDNPESVEGCDFHFKQIIRRQLLQRNVDKDCISSFIKQINLLIVLSYDQIPKGIDYIRAHMDEGSYKTKFDDFWRYFTKTFLKKTTRHDDRSGIYLFTSWNLSHLINKNGEFRSVDLYGNDVMVNRTNNPLERFNGKLNERIPRHATMQVVFETLKEICNEYVDLMKDIKLHRYKPKKHQEVPIPVIPEDFASFKM